MIVEQSTFERATVETDDDTPERAKRAKMITTADLRRSIYKCWRVEDEIWRRLAASGATTASSAQRIKNGLRFECGDDAPKWCEVEAWHAMQASMLRWAEIFGSLQLYFDLRNRKVKDHDDDDDDTTTQSPLEAAR